MCVVTERAAAAPLPAVALPPTPASDIAAGSSGMKQRDTSAAGNRPRCKRAAGTDARAGRALQRQRRSACSDEQPKATADGADQQQEPAAERDSGRSRGGRHRRQSDGGGVSGTAADAPAGVRAVMAGTGEVLAADMTDLTALYQQRDWDSLRSRLQQDGYLLLRGVLPVGEVLKVQHTLLPFIATRRCFAIGRLIPFMLRHFLESICGTATIFAAHPFRAGSHLPAKDAARGKAALLRARRPLPRGDAALLPLSTNAGRP